MNGDSVPKRTAGAVGSSMGGRPQVCQLGASGAWADGQESSPVEGGPLVLDWPWDQTAESSCLLEGICSTEGIYAAAQDSQSPDVGGLG